MQLSYPQGLTYFPFRQLKTFDDISSVLTLTSPSRLDLPEIYGVAKENLSSFFPHRPIPYYEFGQLEEALVLALEHDVKPVRDVYPQSMWVYCVLTCLLFPVRRALELSTFRTTCKLPTIRHDPDSEGIILRINHPHRHRCGRFLWTLRDPPDPLFPSRDNQDLPAPSIATHFPLHSYTLYRLNCRPHGMHRRTR